MYTRVLELGIEAASDEDADWVADLVARGVERNWDGVSEPYHRVVRARLVRPTEAEEFVRRTATRRFVT